MCTPTWAANLNLSLIAAPYDATSQNNEHQGHCTVVFGLAVILQRCAAQVKSSPGQGPLATQEWAECVPASIRNCLCREPSRRQSISRMKFVARVLRRAHARHNARLAVCMMADTGVCVAGSCTALASGSLTTSASERRL